MYDIKMEKIGNSFKFSINMEGSRQLASTVNHLLDNIKKEALRKGLVITQEMVDFENQTVYGLTDWLEEKEKAMNYDKFDEMILNHIKSVGPITIKSIFWYMKDQWAGYFDKVDVRRSVKILCDNKKIEVYNPEEEEEENEIAWW